MVGNNPKADVKKPMLDNENDSEGKVDLYLSEDDLFSSQELVEFAKSVGVDIQGSYESGNAKVVSKNLGEGAGVYKDKKTKAKVVDMMEGVRRIPRLDNGDDTKVVGKAINRAEARNAFLHKGKFHKPFLVLISNDEILLGVAKTLDTSLGRDNEEAYISLYAINAFEESRSNFNSHPSHSPNIDSSLLPSEYLRVVSSRFDRESQNAKDCESDEGSFLDMDKGNKIVCGKWLR
jgi:hypothetical protein